MLSLAQMVKDPVDSCEDSITSHVSSPTYVHPIHTKFPLFQKHQMEVDLNKYSFYHGWDLEKWNHWLRLNHTEFN